MDYPTEGTFRAVYKQKELQIWKTYDRLCGIELYPPNIELEALYQKGEKTPKWLAFNILLDSILYFSHEGEVYTETKISGGGSAGLNIGGAIAGALIAGPIGAVIGSRPNTAPIKSETIKHDERKTILVCKDRKLVFAPEDYNAFMQLIPEKELSVVQQQKAIQAAKANSMPSIEERLTKLKDLLDKDLITEDEYNQKRHIILDEI